MRLYDIEDSSDIDGSDIGDGLVPLATIATDDPEIEYDALEAS